MAIKCNVVTILASSAIPKDQRVTLCGSDWITLTLPVFDDIDITSNTRFVVVVPAGSGYTTIQMATADGTLFDANGLTTYILPSEGQFEFCINNSRWYCQFVTTSTSNSFVTGSTFTKTADTTQATISGLSADVAASNFYRFEARLFIDADAVGGFNVGFGGTATMTGYTVEVMYFDDVGTANFSRRLVTFPGSFGGHVGSTQGFMMVQGFFTVNTAGTFTVQFSQSIASGSSSVNARSTLEVYQG